MENVFNCLQIRNSNLVTSGAPVYFLAAESVLLLHPLYLHLIHLLTPHFLYFSVYLPVCGLVKKNLFAKLVGKTGYSFAVV